MACIETMQQMGLNPFREIARLAISAEKQADLSTASANWRYLGEFIDAKRKAFDPDEQQERAINSMKELQNMREAILSGALEAGMQLPVVDIVPEPQGVGDLV